MSESAIDQSLQRRFRKRSETGSGQSRGAAAVREERDKRDG